MTAFSPEFSAYWLPEPLAACEREGATIVPQKAPIGVVAPSPAQEVALEELAERVNAARSIV
jgi:hypothetical protein